MVLRKTIHEIRELTRIAVSVISCNFVDRGSQNSHGGLIESYKLITE
jgi:hypothetical protein